MRTTWLLLSIVSTAAIPVLACGSSSPDGASGGVGSAAEGGTDSSGGSSDTSAFCSKLASVEAACPPVSRCSAAEVQYCATWAPSFSAGFEGAVENCLPAACPGDGGGSGSMLESACLISYLSTPTTAQKKVKSDFCATCPDGASPAVPDACTNFFALTADDAGNIVAVGGGVLEVSDTLAATMDAQCTGTAASDSGNPDCAESFALCAGEVILFDANLPAACTDVQGRAPLHKLSL
jgi:hypothetical protein